MPGSAPRHDADPSRLVEAAFQRICVEHMSDVPIVNPALRVQALDFALWQENWLGVLITPWCINLMLLPGPNGHWKSVSGNHRLFHSFPSGNYAFLGGKEAEIGEYQSCSLISEMSQFAEHESACAVAREVIKNMLKAPDPVPEALKKEQDCKTEPSLSKRRFLLLGSRN
ncbi:MAG: [NiFe]-hydrogenase assembly chaperone HybE [Proteobacteria bacterium]|nr:[NiFe]-hydrogenase assembly chaperone HybE [Pseudomonadota bacterium]